MRKGGGSVITGTFGAQTPVAEIDGHQIGNGGAGPVTEQIRALYRAAIAEEVARG